MIGKDIFEHYDFLYFPRMMHTELIRYDRLLDFLFLLSIHLIIIITVATCGVFFQHVLLTASSTQK